MYHFNMQDNRCFRKRLQGRGFLYLGFAIGILFILIPIFTKYQVVFVERSCENFNPPETTRRRLPNKPPQKTPGYLVDEQKFFSFVSPGLKNGDNLFKSGTASDLSFSNDFYNKQKGFDLMFNCLLKGNYIIEGHIGSLMEQSLAYFLWANASFVRTICETGFNGGHSALVYLSANPYVHVYSFDLGEHYYSKPMANYLQKVFPGRLHVTWGNSINTVPAFVKANPDVKCDIISVDGGHDYDSCKADLRNLRALADKEYNIVFIDDYPIVNDLNLYPYSFPGVAKAWEEELADKQVQEHFKFNFYSQPLRGFTVGKYINL